MNLALSYEVYARDMPLWRGVLLSASHAGFLCYVTMPYRPMSPRAETIHSDPWLRQHSFPVLALGESEAMAFFDLVGVPIDVLIASPRINQPVP